MIEELMIKRLREAWDKKLGTLVERRGMLVLGACKGYLTEKVKL
jgi:hypothetical protein